MTEDFVTKTLQQYQGKELEVVKRTIETVSMFAPEALERTAQLADTYRTRVLDEITLKECVSAYWLDKQNQQRGATANYDHGSKTHGTIIKVNWQEEEKEFEQRLAEGYVLPYEKVVLESAYKKRAEILNPIMDEIGEMARENGDGGLVKTVAETLTHEKVLSFLSTYSGVVTPTITSILPVLAQTGPEKVLQFLDDYVRRVERAFEDI
ncbi:MAG: hypothetical protein Q7S55_03335 [Nanoarchaeota archaeon]|nr:hypothetical protein [Nanoarchaeota archaeon]